MVIHPSNLPFHLVEVERGIDSLDKLSQKLALISWVVESNVSIILQSIQTFNYDKTKDS